SPQSVQQTELNVSQEQIQSQKQLYILPVAGEISQKFSGDILVKNKTLNVWRTHNGIDINANSETPVKACNDGTVIQIFEDGVWGVAVKIQHSDGIITTCYGLNKEINVKEKDNVKLGDIIGKVDVIPAEKDTTHIHFEAIKDDKFIDPSTLITKG
ncbi:MAG: M23 family metallopeptidase, partial [Clostridia bacterium]